jgi:hypothetical protein
MWIKLPAAFLLAAAMLFSCGKPRDKHVKTEIEAQETARGNTVESFLITGHKEKSPQSHTFYYEAQVLDKAGKKTTIKDSLWLYQRNDSTWTVVPK